MAGIFFCFSTTVQAILLMHLPLDGDLNDISGNNNNGSFPGGNRNPGFANAVFSQGLNFDGNNDYITVPSFNPGSTFSASLWVNHDNIGALNTFIEHVQNGNNRNDFYIGYDNSNNQLTIELEDNNTTEGGACGDPKFCTGIALNSNRWYHIVVTVTPTTLKVYIDANLAYSVVHSTTVNFTNGSWLLGGDTDNSPITTANNDYLDGRIDEVHIFSHELTTTEISQLYGLTGFWKFDDCTIADSVAISDSSGYNNTGTAFAGVSSTTGKICTAGLFDGTTGYVQIPHNTNLNGSTALTYSAWINPTSWSGGIRQIMAKSVHGGGSGRAQMGIFSEGGVLKGRAETTGGQREVTMTLPSAGNWHHVALVFNGTSLTLYIDGNSNTNNFATTTLKPTTDELDISKRVGTSQYFFDGAIDEVKVFNRALVSEEIFGYNANPNPQNRTCPLCGITPATGCASDYGVYSLGNMDISGTVTINGNIVANYVGSANDGIDSTTGALIDVSPVPTLPDISPSTFPNNSSNRDLSNPTTVLGAPADPASPSGFYDDITVTSTTTFSGGTYYIDRLTVGNGDTINLAPGNYFIDNLIMGTNSHLIISPAGAVNIFIGTEVSTGNNVDLNAGGDAANLTISLYSGVNFELDNNGTLAGIVYSPYTNVDLDFDAGVNITGAIITNGDVDLDNNTTITYGVNEKAAAATLVQCTGSWLHHYEIDHDGIALTCNPEQITIRACANATCTTPHNTTPIDITLAPTGWVNGDTQTITGILLPKLAVTSASIQSLNITNSTVNPSNGLAATICKNTATLATGVVGSAACDLTYYDSGFIFNNETDANTIIPTQLSGKNSDIGYNAKTITLQAVQKSNSDPTQCVPAFQNKNLNIDFAAECRDPANCITGQQLILNGSTLVTNNNNAAIGSSSYDTRLITFDGSGKYNLTINYPEAGLIELHARHNILSNNGVTPSGNFMSGSSVFVVRPFAFHIDITANPKASLPTGTAFTSAGTDFTVNVQAVRWQSTDDDGSGGVGIANDGIADGHEATDTNPSNNVDLSDNIVTTSYGQETTTEQAILNSLLNQPSGGNDPGLDDSSANGKRITSFNSTTGIGTTSTINYDEVGIIEIYSNVFDNDYLGIGLAETSKIVGRSGYVGRFTPHHFDTSIIEGCSVSNNYTYSGQPFSVTALARNLTGAPTQNYQNVFAYVTTISNAGVSPVINFTNNTISAANFNAGIGTRTDVIYTFPLKETIPETITLRARDADTPTATGTEESTQIRSGRMRLENVFGSELSFLTMPLNVEYYSDNTVTYDPLDPVTTQSDDGFILNTDDSCTSYDATAGALTNYIAPLTTGDSTVTGAGTVSLGLANITFSAPGAGNDGSVNLLANNVSSWLTYNWNVDCDNADADDDITTGIDAGLCGPSGIASFGFYRGDDRVIHWREVF